MDNAEEVENYESPSLVKIREIAKKYKEENNSDNLYIEKLTFVDGDLDDIVFIEII